MVMSKFPHACLLNSLGKLLHEDASALTQSEHTSRKIHKYAKQWKRRITHAITLQILWNNIVLFQPWWYFPLDSFANFRYTSPDASIQ